VGWRRRLPFTTLLQVRQGVASRPRMVAGQPAHVAKAPPFYPKGVVVELKREIVERKGGRRWPASH
jgi:hypothetical protein